MKNKTIIQSLILFRLVAIIALIFAVFSFDNPLVIVGFNFLFVVCSEKISKICYGIIFQRERIQLNELFSNAAIAPEKYKMDCKYFVRESSFLKSISIPDNIIACTVNPTSNNCNNCFDYSKEDNSNCSSS